MCLLEGKKPQLECVSLLNASASQTLQSDLWERKAGEIQLGSETSYTQCVIMYTWDMCIDMLVELQILGVLHTWHTLS